MLFRRSPCVFFIASLVWVVNGALFRTCIRYETYVQSYYTMASDRWFSFAFHTTPRRYTRISLRTKLMFSCRPGYHRSVIISNKPICTSPCPENSHCFAPDRCTCDDGYHADPAFGCSINTTTTGLPSVETISTAVLTTTNTGTTNSPCKDGCGLNEECSTQDGKCVCIEGYEKSERSTCVPKCEPICQNADCIAPNTCSCWPHYIETNRTFCHLQCTELSCIYGECDVNGACICAPGFLNNGTSCSWAGDAILAEPDDCDCWSRFVWHGNNTHHLPQNQCLQFCDEEKPDLKNHCINYKQCRYYEKYLVCPEQVFKCYDELEADKPSTSQAIYYEEQTKVQEESYKAIIIPLVVFVVLISLGSILFAWLKCQNCFDNGNYQHMENEQQENSVPEEETKDCSETHNDFLVNI